MIVTLEPQKNKSLLQLLQERDIPIPAICGGVGRCGRCRVKILEGNVPVTGDDLNIFGKARCDEGWRLACRAYISAPVTLEVKLPGEAKILTDFAGDTVSETSNLFEDEAGAEDLYVAIDLGTTTVVAVLLDSTGEVLKIQSFINPQTAFGADVISRIQASNDGKNKQLQSLIVTAVRTAVLKLLAKAGREAEKLKLIAIAGNTTMLHLLRGYDCEGIAAYPFEPVNLRLEHLDASELLGEEFGCAKLVLFPGISTFTGADIVAGIYGTDLKASTEPTLLMDLGTNGEMVLSFEGKLYSATAAAGPAFEGGNLSCGMGCTRGAVDSVKLKKDATGRIKTMVSVVGDTTPEGICGSGAIDLLSELLKEGLVNAEGTLCDKYFDDGFSFGLNADEEPLVLTQKDIRELQLAKASIRAAAELLLTKAGTGSVRILLAGGMGNGLKPGNSEKIGLFPENRGVEAVGNTCLAGLKKYIDEVRNGRAEKAEKELENIAAFTQEIPVAEEADFQVVFLNKMNF